MKIAGNSNSSPNFKGVYRIKCSPNIMNEIKSKVIPVYEAIRKEPVACFEENPLQDIVKEKLNDIARSMNYSLEWLLQNSKKHGIDLSYLDKNSIIVISKKEDMREFVQKISSLKTEKNFFQKLKSYFMPDRADLRKVLYVESKPEHLKEVAEIDCVYKSAIDKYSKCLNSFDIVDVQTPQELLQKLFVEK